MHDESISVKLKQEIDEHIAHCSYCQGQLFADKKVKDLISNIESIKRDDSFWQKLFREIKLYRDKLSRSLIQRILDILPIEPVVRRTAVAGAACCAAVIFFAVAYITPIIQNGRNIDEAREDIKFYLQEHEVLQDSGLFGGFIVSGVLVSDIEPSGMHRER